MIVAKFPVHDCSATDHPVTRGSAFASGLALVAGTDQCEELNSLWSAPRQTGRHASSDRPPAGGHRHRAAGSGVAAWGTDTNAHDGRRLSGDVTWRTQ